MAKTLWGDEREPAATRDEVFRWRAIDESLFRRRLRRYRRQAGDHCPHQDVCASREACDARILAKWRALGRGVKLLWEYRRRVGPECRHTPPCTTHELCDRLLVNTWRQRGWC